MGAVCRGPCCTRKFSPLGRVTPAACCCGFGARPTCAHPHAKTYETCHSTATLTSPCLPQHERPCAHAAVTEHVARPRPRLRTGHALLSTCTWPPALPSSSKLANLPRASTTVGRTLQPACCYAPKPLSHALTLRRLPLPACAVRQSPQHKRHAITVTLSAVPRRTDASSKAWGTGGALRARHAEGRQWGACAAATHAAWPLAGQRVRPSPAPPRPPWRRRPCIERPVPQPSVPAHSATPNSMLHETQP
jgi:hypothetical protein